MNKLRRSASDGGFPAGDSHQGPPEVRMIGDFDDSTNALWTLYGKEVKSHDEACIETLKDDMDGVLIFVRLHSVCLTSRVGWSRRSSVPPLRRYKSQEL